MLAALVRRQRRPTEPLSECLEAGATARTPRMLRAAQPRWRAPSGSMKQGGTISTSISPFRTGSTARTISPWRCGPRAIRPRPIQWPSEGEKATEVRTALVVGGVGRGMARHQMGAGPEARGPVDRPEAGERRPVRVREAGAGGHDAADAVLPLRQHASQAQIVAPSCDRRSRCRRCGPSRCAGRPAPRCRRASRRDGAPSCIRRSAKAAP